MRRTHSIRISLTIFLLGLGLYFFWKHKGIYLEQIGLSPSPKLSPITANGSVVFKSFQTSQPDNTLSPHVAREPASKKRNNMKEIMSRKGKDASEERKDTVHINGAPYVWLRSLIAKRTDSGSDIAGSPDGYSLSLSNEAKQNFGVFDSEALFVVTDGLGLEKRIITGAFIVEIQDMGKIEALARIFKLDIAYLAPQIRVAILQARNGQSLFEVESALRSAPDVTKVTMEVLGKGAVAK